jgi:hypothetical protein
MDWINSFVEATEAISSPTIFRKWAAISAVSGALERKVWFRSAGSITYPNLYIVLVGPPGVGKTEIIFRVRDLWSGLKSHHVAPASVTKASLIDALNAGIRHISRPQEVPSSVVFNSTLIASDELGVLLPSYDLGMMNTLQHLYDCKVYTETRRGRDVAIEVKNPHISMLAGCTPSYLGSIMPEGAWEQGFTARTVFVYCGTPVRVPLFGPESTQNNAMKEVQKRLADISKLYGKVEFTPEAAERAQAWADNDCAPKPEHPRLIHYNTRRILQALKLSVIASASESDRLVIEAEHFSRAVDWLVEAEYYMPDIFKAMTGSTHAQLIEDIYYFVLKAYNAAGKKPVHTGRVFNFVQQRTPAHNVEKVLEIMVKANLLENQIGGYVPRTREA